MPRSAELKKIQIKIFILVFGIYLMVLTNFSWAQQYQSMQEIMEDTAAIKKIIPVSLLSRAVDESDRSIQEISQKLVLPLDLLSMDSILSEIRQRVEVSERIFTEEVLNGSGFIAVHKEIPELEKYLSSLEAYNDRIEDYIRELDNANTKIQQMVLIWQSTREEEWFGEVSQVLRDQINILVQKAEEVKEELVATINKYLESQIKVNNLIGRIENIRDALNEKEASQDQNLMSKSTAPVWEIIGSDDDRHFRKTNFQRILELRLNDLIDFYRLDRNQLFISIIIFILVNILFYYLKNLVVKTDFAKELSREQNIAFRLLQNNWLTGMVLSLLMVYVSLSDKPLFISNLIFLISLIPLYILFKRLVDKKLYFLIKFLFVIFFLTLISQPFLEFIILRRIHFIVLNILTVIWLIYFIYKDWLGIFENRFILKAVWLLSRVFIILLVISLLTNLYGSFNFTVFVTFAISSSFFFGLLLYLLFLITAGITISVLFSKPAGKFRIIRNHRSLFRDRIMSILRIITFLLYIVLFLRSFEILDDVNGFIEKIVSFGISIGNFSFAIGDIFLFVIVMIASVWISNFIVFILAEQVYDNTRKKKNLAASVSALVKFAVITAGFLLGIIAVGFELDKLTILLSAFGVGIGFGLQNIFNNLVSGIIMVFEKPLQVGDVVEVGQLIGEVKKIGIRSSVVRTFDGSEVIVPNGNLISNELINWTHSDMQRRLIVKVGVEYGTNPEKVLELLTKVAVDIPGIMNKPKPYALFTEFGDSSLNFELRCWTDNFDDWLVIISNLRVKVNLALKNAGITIPFPQRDVHVYSDNPVKIENISLEDEKKK